MRSTQQLAGDSCGQHDWRAYTIEQLFGALLRVGVPGGKHFFEVLAASNFPSQIAEIWRIHFIKTQSREFTQYDLEATAEELWSRLIGPSPERFARHTCTLFDALYSLIEGRGFDAQGHIIAESAFENVETQLDGICHLQETLAVQFSSRALSFTSQLIPELIESLRNLPEQLVIYGTAGFAERLMQLQRFLDPHGVVLSRAGVLAARGEHQTAIQHLLTESVHSAHEHGIAREMARRFINLGALREAIRYESHFAQEVRKLGHENETAKIPSLESGETEKWRWSPFPGCVPAEGATWRWLRGWGAIPGEQLKAEDVLSFFNVLWPPVDVESLVERLGVKVVTRPDMALPGYTIFSPDYRTAEFWVRASDTYPRRRFTLAFLLGYLLLNPLEGSHQRQQENDYEDPLYTQALEFASSLLIPTWMLEQRLSRAGAAANGRRLARVFRVSGDAMSMALKRL